MADIKIPFKYCRIERAAQFLNCEIEDLLTLGLENKITINVKFNGGKSRLVVRNTVDDSEKWLAKKVPLDVLHTEYVSITDYSIFKFDTIDITDDGDFFIKPAFSEVEGNNNISVSCEGRAFGLWRLSYEIDDLLNDKVTYLNSTTVIPCLPDNENIVTQLLFTHYSHYEISDEGYTYYNRITDKDLWVTAFDIRRLLDCNGDYHTIESVDKVVMVKNSEPKLQPVHPVTDRHASNREEILIAAIRFKEEQPNAFAENCIKDDGSINYTGFARELLDRPSFFPSGGSPVRTTEAIVCSGIVNLVTNSEVISSPHKQIGDNYGETYKTTFQCRI